MRGCVFKLLFLVVIVSCLCGVLCVCTGYTRLCLSSGGAGGIAARGQLYMGAPIGVVEIHLQLEIAAPVKEPWPPPCTATVHK